MNGRRAEKCNSRHGITEQEKKIKQEFLPYFTHGYAFRIIFSCFIKLQISLNWDFTLFKFSFFRLLTPMSIFEQKRRKKSPMFFFCLL